MLSNPGYVPDDYVPDDNVPKLTAYNNNNEHLKVDGHDGERSRRNSVIFNNTNTGKALVQGPGDLVWMRPRADADKIYEAGDDPCDYVERDAMDEAERDESDEEAEARYSFCAETRYNCGRFKEILEEEAYLLKRTMKKVDVKKKAKKCCSLEKVKNIFPILEWAPRYRMPELQGDIIAGITVGMTLIPQAIAYAKIAGLPAQYGLYSSILGCFIYVVLGTSKDVACGPTAIQSLLTANYGKGIVPGDPTRAILLGFFTGIMQLGMYILSLGKLIDLIPFSVMKAFTVACSFTIGFTQIKKWFGLKNVPGQFMPQLAWTFRKIPQTRLWDFLLGCICIFFIVLFRKLKEMKWKRKLRDLPWRLKIVKKGLWFIGTGRNIIVLVLASVVAYIFLENGQRPFSLTGYMPKGIPKFRTPNFTVYDPNKNVTLTLGDLASEMTVGIIIVPVLGLIETMSIVKVYARKFNYKAIPNQELLPFGICNLLGSFIQGYPVCASFSRTAVNAGSGVKTPAGSIMAGAIILIALQFLTPLFYYIPEAALAVVIIMAVLDPITFHKVWIFWKTRKIDLLPWLVTFVLSFVLSIEWGVLIGSGLSILMLLYPVVRPTIRIHEPEDEIDREKMKVIIVTIDTGLMYPAVEYIKDKIFNYCMKVSGAKYVVLDFSHVSVIDTTTVQGVRELLEDFNKKGIKVFLCGMQKGVATIFRKASPRFFNQAATVSDAVTICAKSDGGAQKNGAGILNVSDGPKPAVLHYLWEVTHKGAEGLNNQTIQDAVHQIEAENPPSRRTSRVSNHEGFNRLS